MKHVDHDMLIETVRVRGVFWYDEDDIGDFVFMKSTVLLYTRNIKVSEKGEYGEMSTKRYLGK